MIIDISHHQNPDNIDYNKLSNQVDWVIIRTQYGSNLIDRYYRTHHEEFKKRGIPTAAYAWVRGISIVDMENEAQLFYNRTIEFNPTFWFLDVEERRMNNLPSGISAYVRRLRELGAGKVGIYVGHHLYENFNLNLEEADAIWIPHYGRNDGTPNSKPIFPCDIHQYTSRGRLEGYNGNLDLNRILSDKSLSYFTDENVPSPEEIPSNWAREDWEWATSRGLLDGTRPRDYVTREELAIVLRRLNKNDLY